MPPPLDDAAVEEGLRHLLGWEGRDNEIVKTFVRADFAHTMMFVKGSSLGASSPRTSSTLSRLLR